MRGVLLNTLCAVAFVCPSWAIAQPAGTGSARAGSVSVGGTGAVFVSPLDDGSALVASTLETNGEEVMAAQPNTSVADIDRVLSPGAYRSTDALIARARQALTEGKSAYAATDSTSAVAKLMSAVGDFEQAFAYLPDDSGYEEALLYLSASALLEGDSETAMLQFRRLLSVKPDVKPDPRVFPPMVTEALETARRELTSLPLTELLVDSQPTAARVYLDGQFVGVTPLTLPSVTTGDHLLVYEKLGYIREVQRTLLLNQGASQVMGRLRPGENQAYFSDVLARAQAEAESRQVGESVRELARFIGVRYLLLGRAVYSGLTIQLSAALYDTQSVGTQLTAAEQRTFDSQSPKLTDDVRRFYAGMFDKSRLSTVSVAPVPVPAVAGAYAGGEQGPYGGMPGAEARVGEDDTLIKKWWFWTAIVGGAALVAGGVTAAILLSNGGGGGGTAPDPNGRLVLTF
jgi:hypothetical protein